MKVLHLISSEGFYGAETMLLNLSQALAGCGVQVIVGAFRDSRDPHTEVLSSAHEQGLETLTIPCEGRFDWNAVRRLRKFLLERGIDVAHSHGYKADIYTYFATLARPAKLGRTARVATCHNWPMGARVMQYYATLDRVFLRAFDRVATPSPVVAEILRGSGVHANRVSFIGNGVNVARFSQGEPDLGFNIAGFPLIGLVGRLVRGKGGAILLQAAKRILARFPSAKFVFVGEGPARGELKRLSEDLGIGSHVVFAGARGDMPGVYASLDIVTLPSLEEAMPMCLLEAMAARRAVVATKVGAVPDVVRHEVTGCLIEPGDSEQLADAVIGLLQDSARAQRIAEAGYKHVVNHYSSQAMASAYLELYSQACRAQFPSRLTEGFAR